MRGRSALTGSVHTPSQSRGSQDSGVPAHAQQALHRLARGAPSLAQSASPQGQKDPKTVSEPRRMPSRRSTRFCAWAAQLGTVREPPGF